MSEQTYRPFLVADRPASLRMIRGSGLEAFETPAGIMTHANVSSTVQDFVREFPASGGFYNHGTTSTRYQEYEDEGKYAHEGEEPTKLTELGERISKKTITISDSGVFTAGGSDFSDYTELYNVYRDMDVDYGIIIDVLNDPDATVEAAEEAIAVYEDGDYSFDLIGVAQGTDVTEYLSCYDELHEMGYEKIAIGGLLQSEGEQSGAFASVSTEEYMESVLRSVREAYPDDWLFALGCHHPHRRELFKDIGLFGADYKGWIYKYNSKNGRGPVEARNWRYRNIRSFIRNNILTDAWIPPREELSVPDVTPHTLVVFAPPTSSQSIALGEGTILERIDDPATEVITEYEETGGRVDRVCELVWTDDSGLVPGDYRPLPNGTSARTLSIEKQEEELRLDLEKYHQYRSFENVLLVGDGDIAEVIDSFFRSTENPISEPVSYHAIFGQNTERKRKLSESLERYSLV